MGHSVLPQDKIRNSLQKNVVSADLVIIGGGIAGLWLLNEARRCGLTALLFESADLGGGQTYKSQGIIHGGMKYALQGIFTRDAHAIAAMPALWKSCLAGTGPLDLTGVPLLSPAHYLWAPNKLSAKIGGAFAQAALNSKVHKLSREAYPLIFQHPSFKGEVFSLDEIVIDVPALVRHLVKSSQDALFKIEPLTAEDFNFEAQGKLTSLRIHLAQHSLELHAQHFVFTAGQGNALIINQLNQKQIAMQQRPLHMVLVKPPVDYPVFAHCLGMSNRPRLTITTHRSRDAHAIWYLGGLLAEEGIHRDSAAQIQAAKTELSSLFPWLDFNHAHFTSFMVNRAEPLQANGLKPETSHVDTYHNISIAWPTKLALAPQLSAMILNRLASLQPQLSEIRALRAWPMPPLAKPIWDEL